MERRSFVKHVALAGAGLPWLASLPEGVPQRKGNINHSVCKWCYGSLSVEELAFAASRMGIGSIDLLHPHEWADAQKYGLTCAMSFGPQTGHDALSVGFNHLAHHEFLVPAYKAQLALVAEAGLPNLICFSGNRAGMDDEEGLENCARGLEQLLPDAERLGITLCMELLNSKVDHIDYQCDHTAWGARLVDRLGSDRFKLLYDIYHMQIMEGDVIRTLRQYKDYIAHYHTGGNPGRNEIDDTQELNYPAIMRAIVDTGFTGFVAQEFIPTKDPLLSLGQAIALCDV